MNLKARHGQSLHDFGSSLHQSLHIMLEPCLRVRLYHVILHHEFFTRDHRTTASGTTIRCSFGSVTVNESVSHGRMGGSPESRQLVQERFQAATLALIDSV